MPLPPIVFAWTGEAMVPLGRYLPRCNERFVVGANYVLEFKDHRSGASHRHYFAAVREAWKNLPEDIAIDFPSPEHLRKYALVKCNYANERTFVWDTPHDAKQFAATLRRQDEFVVVVVEGNVVKEFRARSQKPDMMDPKEFQASKDAVLAFVADLIGVTPADLSLHARTGEAP